MSQLMTRQCSFHVDIFGVWCDAGIGFHSYMAHIWYLIMLLSLVLDPLSLTVAPPA